MFYIEVNYHLVGEIKTSYFMMDENNYKKQGGYLSVMTSSSTTPNFISLSQSLTPWRRFRHYDVKVTS